MNKLMTLCAVISMTASIYAQAPEKMSYQAVVRNASDNLVSSSQIGMQISILQGSANGSPVYVETQTPTSNQNGLVSIEIGGGTVITGTFAAIDWANGPFFIKTETDPSGGTNYTITGTSQLLSVPYALHAGSVSHEQQNISDVLQNGNNADGQNLVNLDTLAVGLTNPTTAKLVINAGAGQQGLDLSTYDSYANMRVLHNSNGAFDKDMYFGLLSGDTSSLHFFSNNGEAMTLKNNCLGVGIQSPLERLEINGSINMIGFLKFQGTNVIYGNPNDVYGNYRVLQNNSATQQDGMYINFNSAGNATAHLRFYANGATERMFIDASNGNVGIGTTTPAQRLHVNAVMRLEPTSAPANPSMGDIYMDGSTHKLMVFDGTIWQACW